MMSHRTTSTKMPGTRVTKTTLTSNLMFFLQPNGQNCVTSRASNRVARSKLAKREAFGDKVKRI